MATLGAAPHTPAPSPEATPTSSEAKPRKMWSSAARDAEILVDRTSKIGLPTSTPQRHSLPGGPPLVETRVFDTGFCRPGPQAFATAYIQFCLDPVTDCPDGQTLRPARESRSRQTGTADWSPWQPLSPAVCVTPGEENLVDNVRTAFAEMTITPSPITHIDVRGWTFVQIDTVIYSDSEPQTLATTVGGMPVELRATPVEWRWDFGDESKPVTTATPGGPYPTSRSPTSTPVSGPTQSLSPRRGEGSGAWKARRNGATSRATTPLPGT